MKKSYLALIIALLSSCGADETLTVREESQPVSVGAEFRSPAEVLAIAANVLLSEGEDLTDQHHIHWGYGINSAGYYDQKNIQIRQG